jgi:serine/threonine protein kinase
MLAGLNFLHNAGLVNRDIKLENMLIGDDFKIRMADFGFAT